MTSKQPASTFGKRLREARLRAGIPQDKLGVRIGLDESTASARISRYETGTHAPPFHTAAMLAKELRIPTPYLFCEDDELAALLLNWGSLSKADKKRVKDLVSDLTPS
jgi:transcriptional regulator with XRE-family HTH domain